MELSNAVGGCESHSMNGSNAFTSDFESRFFRESTLLSVLETILAKCDLPDELHAKAQQHYDEKTEHLRECSFLSEFEVTLKPQGSSALLTVVPPVGGKNGEFDVDLLIAIEESRQLFNPKHLHRQIGLYLKKEYEKEIKAIRFGWVLDYAFEDKMHFDVIPAVRENHDQEGKILLVPNWKENTWKRTNPEGYIRDYLTLCKELPVYEQQLINLANRDFSKSFNVAVEPLPGPSPLKSPLQRMTQLAKRHRDIWYKRRQGDGLSRRPASIVLTSILWYGYARSVAKKRFESLFSVLTVLADSLDDSRILIRTEEQNGKIHYVLPNPSLPEENLVTKWNSRDKEHEVREYFEWVNDFRSFVRNLNKVEGRHKIQEHLGSGLGEERVKEVFRDSLQPVAPGSLGRVSSLFVPGLGVTSARGASGGLPLSNHTFHGRR